MAKNIKELPIDDRPYEKLELMGEANLTNSELLAIVIKNGTTNLNCIQIAHNILSNNSEVTNISDLEYLSNISLEELKKFEGIGRKKAILIKAVVELSKRISKTYTIEKKKISSPRDVFELVNQSYIGLKQESIKTLILNKSNGVLSITSNAVGSVDSVYLSIREILSEPIKQMASSIILVHNHPSGNLQPSKQDIKFTKQICEYSSVFNINLLDHIIIGKNEYLSMKSKGYI